VKKILFLSCLIFTLAACDRQGEPAKPAAPRVNGETINFAAGDPGLAVLKTEPAQADKGGSIPLPGRVVWDENRTVRVVPPLAGKVVRVLVKPGDVVRAGQPLAVLSSPDFGQVRADWRKAEAAAGLAAKNLSRSRELHEAGVIPAKELQQAEADHAGAAAEAARAASRYRQLAGTGGEGQEYAIASPIAGTVVERNLNPGQELRPDAPPLFVVTDPTRLWVALDAHEDQLAALTRDKEIRVEARAWPGEGFAARIAHVADFVDPASRTVKVRAELTDPTHQLKGEMFVSAAVPTPASRHLLVPAKAVVLEGGSRHLVFVEIASGQFQRRSVEVARSRGEQVEIAAGLEVGEKVVSEGNLYLLRFYRHAAAPAAPEKAAK
jgi:cobalt-zinc-cadmium efflux system membrane fusion protein